MTIERGQEGTAPRIWSANDIAANMMTAGTLTYIVGNLQPLSANLTALSALIGAANKLPYFIGAGVMSNADLTAVGRDLIGQASVAAMLTYLGLQDAANALIKTNNLSDLPDKPLSRTNLGVPTGVTEQMCTSWVRFDSTGATPAINSAFNVTSVTRTATGKHTIKFTTAMNNANYAFNYTVGGDANAIKGGGGDTTMPTTENLYVSSFRGVGTGSGVPLDAYSFPINNVTTYGGK